MKKTRESIYLNISRALLGEVFPALRLVRFEFDDDSIFVDYYVDGEIAERDSESISCAEAELLADLDASTAVVTRIHCLPATEVIPVSEHSVTVFQRRE